MLLGDVQSRSSALWATLGNLACLRREVYGHSVLTVVRRAALLASPLGEEEPTQ
jgi:hypothetical protein